MQLCFQSLTTLFAGAVVNISAHYPGREAGDSHMKGIEMLVLPIMCNVLYIHSVVFEYVNLFWLCGQEYYSATTRTGAP